MAVNCKGAHVPQESIRTGVRWSVAYPLSPRHVEALLRERAIRVDHGTINRWVLTYSPQREEACHRRQRPVGRRWRRHETSRRVKGAWRDLSRAVEKPGQPIAWRRTERRGDNVGNCAHS